MKNTLRVARAVKAITQDELAKTIGISRQAVIAIESNKYVPSTLLALKMARFFEMPVEQLFILEEND